jgi:photosystem II stability/assembly factor-like uncharacterized protein
MHPKIDETQHLKPPFTITGPVDDGTESYEKDDDLAMAITFVITQDETGAKGVGKSDAIYFQKDKGSNWTGLVTVPKGVPAFEVGSAHVAAYAAIVTDEGEWELYPWGRTVKLVSP